MLDIIIVNYNSTDHAIGCITSIKKALKGISSKLYVMDNCSDDNVDRLSSQFPDVILFKNKTNSGFSKAVNEILKQSISPYIFLINPDTLIFSDYFFEPMLCFMLKNHDVGILGPEILNPDGSVQGSARSFPSFHSAFFGRASVLSKYFPGNRMTRKNILTARSDGTSPMEVDWVSGACMFIRRQAVNNVGMLDERFFMYWEDADWCRRMWQNGWKVVYFPGSSLIHYVGVSSKKRGFRTLLEFHKSAYRLFDKYARWPQKLMGPIVLWGLMVRFHFILFSRFLRWRIQ